MAHFACIIQEGQEPDRKVDALETGLRRISRDFFEQNADDVEIRWDRVGKGWAWTAGEPSTSSIVIRSVPVGYDDREREKLLKAICDLWVATTGCSINEVVAVAFDGPLPE